MLASRSQTFYLEAWDSKSRYSSKQNRHCTTFHDLVSEVTHCHRHHALLVKTTISPSRFKGSDIDIYFLVKEVTENLQLCFKTAIYLEPEFLGHSIHMCSALVLPTGCM